MFFPDGKKKVNWIQLQRVNNIEIKENYFCFKSTSQPDCFWYSILADKHMQIRIYTNIIFFKMVIYLTLFLINVIFSGYTPLIFYSCFLIFFKLRKLEKRKINASKRIKGKDGDKRKQLTNLFWFTLLLYPFDGWSFISYFLFFSILHNLQLM